METRIQSIHFDVSDQLRTFIEKKVTKLAKFYEDIKTAEVTLKITKPETALNKEVNIRLVVRNDEMFAAKTCDSFEEAVDVCAEALSKQLIKYKEKMRSK